MALISENERDLQTMINNMYEWTNKWRLKLNVNKSKIMHFRPRHRQCTPFNFTFGDEVLEKVNEYKYLGIYLDKYLNYRKYSNILSESAGQELGGIISKFQNLERMWL